MDEHYNTELSYFLNFKDQLCLSLYYGRLYRLRQFWLLISGAFLSLKHIRG